MYRIIRRDLVNATGAKWRSQYIYSKLYRVSTLGGSLANRRRGEWRASQSGAGVAGCGRVGAAS